MVPFVRASSATWPSLRWPWYWRFPPPSQTVATSFGELRLKVKPGDIVYVTDDSGKSDQEARILDLTASLLTVSIGGVRLDLDESSVRRIRQRLPDSRKNGALIGSLVGAAASVAGAKALESPAGSCTGGCVAANVLIGGGLGALVGLGIDALIQGRKEIYVKGGSQASRDVVTRPFVSSQTKDIDYRLEAVRINFELINGQDTGKEPR